MSRASIPTLIVRHDPAHPEAAVQETRRILESIGEPDAVVLSTAVAGNLKVIPEGDPHEAEQAVTRLAQEASALFRYTSNWTIVDAWVPSDLQAIRHAVADYQNELRPGESWKVAVRPNHTGLHRQAVLDAVVPLLEPTRVDPDDPDKELRIDILGDETGVGLVDRNKSFGPHRPD